MINSIATLCMQAERLCRRLAPLELPRDKPFYVVAQSTLSEPWQRSTAGGYVEPQLDLLLRSELGERFVGRGPAMIVNDCGKLKLAERDAAEISEAPADYVNAHVARSFVATAVHELAHIFDLDYRYAPSEVVTESGLCLRRDEMLASLDRPKGDFHVPGQPPWFQHGASFIRCALHLEFRAKRLDGDIPAPSFVYDHYSLSPLSVYRRGLGDEPARMLDATFAEIKREPVPELFEFIWQRDVSRWESQAAATIAASNSSVEV